MKTWKVMQCSISECNMKAIETVKIGFKEKRNLCENHYKLFINKESTYKPSFMRATEFK